MSLVTAPSADAGSVSIATVDPSLVAILTMVMVGLVFPVILHNFKKTERLIEETKGVVGQHSTQLATHEVRIMTLEQWRTYYYPAGPAVPQPAQQPPPVPVPM